MNASGQETAADREYGNRIMKTVIWHLFPLILILYIVNYIDRVNLGFAALTMNADLGITPVVFGLVSGIFFIGYVIFEYPSNRLMERYGAKIWISRIILSWGIVVILLAFARSAFDVAVLRLLLGIAEAGFYPGIVFYLSLWLRGRDLARCMSYLYAAQIIAIIIGAPLSTLILDHAMWLDISGWRWLFILEGVPAIILCIVTFRYLTNRPEDASWLGEKERAWLIRTVKAERESHGTPVRRTPAYFLSRTWFNRLWIAFFCEMACGYAIVFWLPQIIHSLSDGDSHTMTGLLIAVPYICALACMLLCAWHSDRTSERKYHLIIPWSAAAAGFFLSAIASDPAIALVSLTLSAAGMYAGVPVFWAIVTDRVRKIDGSGGIALVNALGTLGGFVGPFLMGIFIADSGTAAPGPAMLVFCGFMLVAVMLTLWHFRDNGTVESGLPHQTPT
ncbi:MAG: MFS transporter [Methanoregula sp.]|jgi:ACS family tartrate transporter-like MFS transporter|nr:MFS transporter [Methanoregula sp.]